MSDIKQTLNDLGEITITTSHAPIKLTIKDNKLTVNDTIADGLPKSAYNNNGYAVEFTYKLMTDTNHSKGIRSEVDAVFADISDAFYIKERLLLHTSEILTDIQVVHIVFGKRRIQYTYDCTNTNNYTCYKPLDRLRTEISEGMLWGIPVIIIMSVFTILVTTF